MGTLDTSIRPFRPAPIDYLSGAFAWLVAFFVVYFARPEEYTPIGAFPIAKVVGFFAIASFGLVVMMQPKLLIISLEMKYLIALSLWFFMGAPLSPVWKGGALTTTVNFSKIIPIVLLIGVVANNMSRLKRLIFVETASTLLCVVVTLVAYRFHASEDHRLTGSLNGIYGNPNDLALAIVIVFPFCAMFMLGTTNILKKIFWCGASALMGYALLLTYSRAGVLALVASGVVMVWEFGIRGKRYSFLILAGVLAICILAVGGPKGFVKRVASVIDPSLDPGKAESSYSARGELLTLSLKETAKHPLFGVGAGDFQILSGWHVTHNSYTQVSAEGGIPALILYLLIIRRTFINLRESQRFSRGHPEIQLVQGALRVSLTAFLVGSFFASVCYNYFPYFLIAYTGALLQIAKARAGSKADMDEGNKQRNGIENSTIGSGLGTQKGPAHQTRGYRPVPQS